MTIRPIAAILIGILIGSLITRYTVTEKVSLRVTHPNDSMTRVIRVGAVDYKFIWFPWGAYTPAEVSAKYMIRDSDARYIIRQQTCNPNTETK